MQTRRALFTLSSRLFLIFMVLAVGIGTLGYFYYRNERDRIKRSKHDDLAAIAHLKVDQIARWRKERLMDAHVIARSPHINDTLDQFIGHPSKPELRGTVSSWMTSL